MSSDSGNQKKKKKNVALYVCLSLLAVILVALIIYMIMQSKPNLIACDRHTRVNTFFLDKDVLAVQPPLLN